MSDHYSWVPLFKKLAEALLPYRSRQDELIGVLRDLEAQGYPIISLENKREDGSMVPITEIDPFTFLASLNRGIKEATRLRIAEALRERFDLDAATPDHLDGVPTVNNQSSWFFGWEHMRTEEDIPALWDLAENAVNAQGASDLDSTLFDGCLQIRAVGRAKLTMGLFWLRPDLFLSLDKKTREFLSTRGIESGATSASDYLRLVERVREELSDNFPELSHQAHLESVEAGDDPDEEATSESSYRVWLLHPGRAAEFWEDWVERGIIGVGWDDLGDLAQYESQDAIAEAMTTIYERDNDPKNNALACWEFANAMAEGDLVFVKEGQSTVIAAGIVTSGFRYVSENRKRNRNLREVRWLRRGRWETLPRSRPRSEWGWDKKVSDEWRSEPRIFPRKTLTDITPYQSMRSELEICVGLDRAAVALGQEERCPIRQDVLDAAVNQTILPEVQAGTFEDPDFEGYLHEQVIPKAQVALYPENIEEDPVRAVREALNAHYNLLHSTEIARATDFVGAADPDELRDHLQRLLRGRGNIATRVRQFLEWAGERPDPDGNKDIGFNGTSTSYLLAMNSPATCAFCKPSIYSEAAKRLLGEEHVVSSDDQAERIAHATRFYSDLLRLLRRQYDIPFRDLIHVHSALYVLSKSAHDGTAMWEDLHTDETAVPYTIEDATGDLFYPAEEFESWLRMLRARKNIILQGPPGVGKTFLSKRLAYALMGCRDDRRLEMVQFHQSYAYEDFIQGYRPDPEGGFRLKNGIFYRFCQRAQNDDQNEVYVFIVDEINRGNLSKILGELMMLIEPEKRGPAHAMPLAYQEEGSDRFYVPENLYLIGMMNTADRSLAMVDYALRRRFGFVDMEPRFEDKTFQSMLAERGASSKFIGRVVSRLHKLNRKIADDTTNLGPGFQIGHSYFCPGVGVVPDEEWYRRVVRSEVGPLLREYWFDGRERAERLSEELLEG